MSEPISSLPLRRDLTAEELSVVELVERRKGRPLTPQEINLSLEQARAMGEINDRPRA